MMGNAFVNVYWRAVCGESRKHGSERGSWKSTTAYFKLGNSLAAYSTASEGSPVDEDGYFDTDKEKVDYLFFGLVIGFEIELGYFSEAELAAVRGPLGLPIERDLHYEPKTLGELQKQHRAERGEL